MNRGRRHFPARSRRHTTRRPVNLRLRLLLKKRDAAGRTGQGCTIARHAVPRRLPAPARRNPDKGVPARQPYRPPRRYLNHSRTPYAPGGATRSVPSPGLPCRRPGQEAARRNPDTPVPDRRLYLPRPTCSSGTRTPYAPGAGGAPGSGEGNAEQSAPAARSVAIARRASDTESGSSAS